MSFSCQMYFESSVSLPLSRNDFAWLQKRDLQQSLKLFSVETLASYTMHSYKQYPSRGQHSLFLQLHLRFSLDSAVSLRCIASCFSCSNSAGEYSYQIFYSLCCVSESVVWLAKVFPLLVWTFWAEWRIKRCHFT